MTAYYRKGYGYRKKSSGNYYKRGGYYSKREELIKAEWITLIQEKEGKKGKYYTVRTKLRGYYVPAEDEQTVKVIKALQEKRISPEGIEFTAKNGKLSLLSGGGELLQIEKPQKTETQNGKNGKNGNNGNNGKKTETNGKTTEQSLEEILQSVKAVLLIVEDIRDSIEKITSKD